jgi:hypothetical protein
MAPKAGLLDVRESSARPKRNDMIDVLRRLGAAVQVRIGRAVSSRAARPRIAMLGVPLSVVAAVVSGAWLMVVPLALGAWWWAPRDWGWEWLVAVGRGLIGAEWALVGSDALARYYDHLLVIGTFWCVGAALLGVCGAGVASRAGTLGAGRDGNSVQMRRSGAPVVRKRFAMHLATQAKADAAKKRR